jgi:hypothetical protein
VVSLRSTTGYKLLSFQDIEEITEHQRVAALLREGRAQRGEGCNASTSLNCYDACITMSLVGMMGLVARY